MKRRTFQAALAAAGGAGLVYAAYRKDLEAAAKRTRIAHTRLELWEGPIEFAESGDGPAALVIHGAGGGFDQGLHAGRELVGDAYRVVAPSRFGYLGSPIPEDASPAAQADAYARLLDALQLERVPVIAMSAGAPSAMQFALRHPQRCSGLVLIVPLTYPTKLAEAPSSPHASAALNILLASDFAFWLATKLAHRLMVEKVLGTPYGEYQRATKADRKRLDEFLGNILPVSRRAAGLRNENAVGSSLTERYPLEEITAPTLVISAADCLYGTFDGSVYTAEHVAAGTLVAFTSGGHMLVGHLDAVQARIGAFLRQVVDAPVFIEVG